MQRSGRVDYATIGLLLVSGLGLVFALLSAVSLGLFGLVSVFGEVVPRGDTVPIFTIAWISALVGLLALPAVVLCVLRLLGRVPRLPNFLNGWRLASILMLLWPLVLVAGNAIAGSSRLAWLLLPPLHLLAIGLPLWWLVELACKRLPGGSTQRGWGILNTSLFVTTPTLIVVELLAIIGLLVLVGVAVSLRPEWLAVFERMAERLALLQDDPTAVMQVLQPILENPLAIYAVLAVLAGLVPLVEELFKPLAVWFLAGRSLSPAEGFVAGAISGGGFALLESLLTLSGPQGDGWAALAVARAGTGLLHITTTALMGWALASAWRSGAYWRLGLAYLLAVVWHGMWNGLSVASGVGALFTTPPAEIAWLMHLSAVAPFGLLVLVISLFLFLWGGNRRLRGSTLVEPTL